MWLDYRRVAALQLGYSQSLKGRKRFYRRPTRERESDFGLTAAERKEARMARERKEAHIQRCGVNHPIQSTCVDLLKPALAKIYLAIRGGSWTGEKLYDAHIVLSAHDEIVLEVREDQAQDVENLVKRCMEEAFTDIIKTVGIKVDMTTADYWKK